MRSASDSEWELLFSIISDPLLLTSRVSMSRIFKFAWLGTGALNWRSYRVWQQKVLIWPCWHWVKKEPTSWSDWSCRRSHQGIVACWF